MNDRPLKTRDRIPELDGLRVLMIFVVSWFHIWQQSWLEPVIRIPALGIRYSLDWLVRSGYVWVDGTVLLSAFLIWLPFEKARVSGEPFPATGDFYFRRAKRILPGYWFIMLLTLFVVVLPGWDPYRSAPFMVKDLFTHFTLIFNLFRDTYLGSPLGGAPWTLAVIAQGYLLFPLLARCIRKRPAVTLTAMVLIAFGFRAWCLWGLTDYAFVVNQLVNFLDVYAAGILCAMGYVRIKAWFERETARDRALRNTVHASATLYFFVFLYGLCKMLQVQAGSPTHFPLQGNQMMFRPVFALCFAGLVLTAPFAAKPLRLLLGNPVMKFLSMISMNYYLLHQTVAVHLKRLRIPPSQSLQPNVDRELSWMMPYTWLCFGLSVALAAAITFLIEKPGGKVFDWLRKRRQSK